MQRVVPRFSDYATRWLEEICKVEKSYSYHKKCAQTVRDYLNPRIGHLLLNQVTSQDIRELQRHLHSKGFAVQTISNILATASSMFKEAVADPEIGLEANSVAGVKRLKRELREMQVWTFEEKNRFLSYVRQADFRVFQIVAFALHTGLRPMELRGLLRDAIDFDLGLVRVRRQWCSKQNMLVEYTKTRTNRTVSVPREVLQILTDKRGLPMDAQLFPEIKVAYGHLLLKPMMRAAGVREIRMHDLRHTFASHLLMKGAHIMEVKEVLGHRKLESTMVYLHFVGDRNKGTTDRLIDGASWLSGSGDNVVRIGSVF